MMDRASFFSPISLLVRSSVLPRSPATVIRVSVRPINCRGRIDWLQVLERGERRSDVTCTLTDVTELTLAIKSDQ